MESSNVVVAYDPNMTSKFMPELKSLGSQGERMPGFSRREDDNPEDDDPGFPMLGSVHAAD